ncbi:hypothetical protein CEXT_340951 [Caerostris extrusa]|uniref:Uncharacterized protein n=1 Tax=Caerostris extrusa TaxID=172846 RepID=A0AAV4MEL4_CAEEX|nr:hypothetical protein CEXT_340951 [Caerostris extrusa]
MALLNRTCVSWNQKLRLFAGECHITCSARDCQYNIHCCGLIGHATYTMEPKLEHSTINMKQDGHRVVSSFQTNSSSPYEIRMIIIMCENIKELAIVRLHSSPSWGPLDMQLDHRYFYPNVRTYKEHAACTILDIALISTLYRCAIY